MARRRDLQDKYAQLSIQKRAFEKKRDEASKAEDTYGFSDAHKAVRRIEREQEEILRRIE